MVTNLGWAELPWIFAALALYVIAAVITIAVHVPLNDAIKAAGNPDRIHDLAGVRERFHEPGYRARSPGGETRAGSRGAIGG
jgi:uncharacterized membrane protein